MMNEYIYIKIHDNNFIQLQGETWNAAIDAIYPKTCARELIRLKCIEVPDDNELSIHNNNRIEQK